MKRQKKLLSLFLVALLCLCLSPLMARAEESKADDLELQARQERDLAARAKERAEEYQKLSDANRRDAKEASEKTPQNLWQETAEKNREFADDYQKQADQARKEAEAFAESAGEKLRQAEAIRREEKSLPPPAGPALAPKGGTPEPTKTDEALSDDTDDSGLSVEDVIGKYKDERGADIVIEHMYHKDKPEEIIFYGKYHWAGRFEKGGKLRFWRTPSAEEINDDAPIWARKKVEEQGKLVWAIELEAVGECGELKLGGDWYPGEIVWNLERDPETGIAKREEAYATGERGVPIPMLLTKIELSHDETEAIEGRPLILARLAGEAPNDLPEQKLVSITKTQAFFIDVGMSAEAAEKAGDSINLDLKLLQSELSSSITLKRQRKEKGLVYFTHDKPLQLTSEGISPDDHIENMWIDGGSRIKNNDELTIAYGDRELSLKVYQAPLQQRIAQVEEGLGRLDALFQAKMMDTGTSKEEREEYHLRVQAIANARRIMAYEPKPGENFSDITRKEVGEVYLKLLLDNSVINNSDRRWRGKTKGNPYGAVWVWDDEMEQVDAAVRESAEDFARKALQTIGQFGVSLFQLTIGNSIGGQFMTVVWGIDAEGNPVDMTDRILAGTNMASQGILFSANAAKALKDLHVRGAMDPLEKRAGAIASVEKGGTTGSISLRPVDPLATTVRPWPGERNFTAPVKVPPLNSQGTPIQLAGNTCGLNVVASIRRDLGMQFVKERELMRIAAQNGWYDAGNLNDGFGTGGMMATGMARCLRAHGARVRLTQTVPLSSHFSQWMKSDKKVALMINVGTPAAPAYHWMRLEGIKCGRGMKQYAIIGDPWNGNSWQVDMNVLRRRIVSVNGVVVAEFPKRQVP